MAWLVWHSMGGADSASARRQSLRTEGRQSGICQSLDGSNLTFVLNPISGYRALSAVQNS